jgi:hydroxyquinol 1,2-dioxygenase
MRDLNEHSISDAVMAGVRGAKNPRLRRISEALVHHLHAFVREIRPTEEEWQAAIDFLTATGQICDGQRQEYILLSDTLGVSTLVDSINHPAEDGATQTTVFGPFYVPPPEFDNGADLRGTLLGAPLYVEGMVCSTDGAAIAGAIVDVWHSDAAGFYDVQQPAVTGGPAGRGRLRCSSGGRFHFWTARPAAYPIPDDGPVGKMLAAQGRHPFRPEHVHFMIQAPGSVKLVTQVFARGDQYLDSDVVFGVKQSLIRDYVPEDGGVAPDGTQMTGRWYRLAYDFALRPAAGA